MKRSVLPLNALRVAEAAARHGSFRAAARELGVTPSAVSQQIRLLEDGIGSPLFQRTSQGIRPTPTMARAKEAMDAGFRRLEAAMTILEDGERPGDLRLSVTPAFASKWLVPRLGSFQDQHPGIVVRVSTSMDLVNFETDAFDLAIRYGSGEYTGLHVQELLRERVIPVCSPSLLGGRDGLLSPGDLTEYVLIHDDSFKEDESCPDWAMWLKAAGVKDVSELKAIHFDRSDLAIEAAMTGRGVTLAKWTIAAADLEDGRLIQPIMLSQPVEFAYYIVTPAERLTRPAVRHFVEWLKDEAGRAAAQP